jgi:tetratricopeptide (TPR) repeat protein
MKKQRCRSAKVRSLLVPMDTRCGNVPSQSFGPAHFHDRIGSTCVVPALGYIANKADPRVLNYLGYSHRKSGRIEVGLGYYQEALRIDPDYTLAREYLGEAHLQLGDVASARNQLDEIEMRCGKGCEEYAELADLIARFARS